ncbi:MAG: hypothetical protein ACLFUF_02530 [Opitutales bacterium]
MKLEIHCSPKTALFAVFCLSPFTGLNAYEQGSYFFFDLVEENEEEATVANRLPVEREIFETEETRQQSDLFDGGTEQTETLGQDASPFGKGAGSSDFLNEPGDSDNPLGEREGFDIDGDSPDAKKEDNAPSFDLDSGEGALSE